MFTGLIEEIGAVRRVLVNSEGRLFEVKAEKVLERLTIGDSVAVDGVCLTVVDIKKGAFTAQAVQETVNRTTLQHFRTGTEVNLERAMPADGRFGGHFVQGHVDGIGVISAVSGSGKAATITIDLPTDLMRYIIFKGSVAINGISLTVAAKSGNRISVAVIPLTMQTTNLHGKKKGDYVNIEVDMMAKYVEQFISGSSDDGTALVDRIRNWGYKNK